MTFDFTHAVVGGTFDHFHEGHKRILDFAFHIAQKVTIGVTTDDFIRKKPFASSLEAFSLRREGVTLYIEQNNNTNRAEVIPLHDIFGPTLTDPRIDAIVVTRETKPNAIKINAERAKNNLPPLKIVTVPFYKGEDNKIVRSSRIREGSINRVGHSYQHYFSKRKQLHLPPRLRSLLRKPLGIIIEGEERFISFTAEKAARWIELKKPVMCITVGDIVTQSLTEVGMEPDIAIVDYRSRRKKLTHETISAENHILNPPGTIRQDAVIVLKQAIVHVLEKKKAHRIIIKGEEDLLALPAILLAPLNAVVVYGQADLGIILIHLDEEIKHKVAAIIEQFE